MSLELHKLRSLLGTQLNEMLNEIQEVSWSDEVVLFSRTHQFRIEVANSTVKLYDALCKQLILGVNWSRSITHIDLSIRVNNFRETVRWNIDAFSQRLGYLKQSVISPITEPVNDTTIEESWTACGSI